MNIDLPDKLIEKIGVANAFFLVYCQTFSTTKDIPKEFLDNLEAAGVARIVGSELVVLDSAYRIITNQVEFDTFWDKYHTIVKEWKKSEKEAARRYWKKLTLQERVLAIDNIKPWYAGLIIIQGRKTSKKARTYLADKNFNDEFEKPKESFTLLA